MNRATTPVKSKHAAHIACVLCSCQLGIPLVLGAQPEYAWRYYRPTNTGIQGDYCDAIWIGPDNDPWIGGYVPQFEEGGLAKFVQAENRWINVSNVDYPEIGHPENTGTTRVRDITQDASGTLWMGTGRGVLKFNPAIGPSSLKRYDASNSPWPGGWVTNIEIAPDGTIWASGYSTAWGAGGMMRFDPTTQTWTLLNGTRPEYLAIQPKPSGGYYVWAAAKAGTLTPAQRYDSTTQTWTTFPTTVNNPRNLPGKNAVDPSGNMWMYRVLANGLDTTLDVLRPDGTWVGVPAHPDGGATVLRAYDTMQAVMDGGSQMWRFDGASWIPLGNWGNVFWTYDVNIDTTGAVWASGIGGAAKRDPATGVWQRYRVTNTSQYDFFNNDLAIDPSGGIYACANAGAGFGGMVRFDGQRWIGFNDAHYGLGHDWPFPTDNSNAVYVRPSNGNVVVNPTFNGTSEWNGSSWATLPGGSSTVVQYVEDSTARLWGLGEYFSLGVYENGSYNNHSIANWGRNLRVDPDQPGTIWANAGYEVTRTDGTYRFSRTVADFAELTTQSDSIWGMAVDRNGVAWLGCSVYLGAGGEGGGLIRLDAQTGQYTIQTYENGWALPGKYVTPWIVTPDGKVWMTYTNVYQYYEGGLCWYDPATGEVGDFPGPSGGAMQWGGLPHTQVYDMEVREIENGYELWMSCASRGIAALMVTDTGCYADCDESGTLNIFDYICFGDEYANGHPYADCDNNSTFNIFDYICFGTAYAAGCP